MCFRTINNARDKLAINVNIYFRVDLNCLIFKTTPSFYFFTNLEKAKDYLTQMFTRPFCQHFGLRVKLGNNRMSPKPSSVPLLIFNIVLVVLKMSANIYAELTVQKWVPPKIMLHFLVLTSLPFSLPPLSKVIKKRELGVSGP